MTNALGVDVERGVISIKTTFWIVVTVVRLAFAVITWKGGQEQSITNLQTKVENSAAALEEKLEKATGVLDTKLDDVSVDVATSTAQYKAQDERINRLSEIWSGRYEDVARRVTKTEGGTKELSAQLDSMRDTLARIEKNNGESFTDIKSSLKELNERVNPIPSRERTTK